MENESSTKRCTANSSRWAVLPAEILALALARMPADEVLRNVSFVCRSWREALSGPYCWSDVDLEQWCRRVNSTGAIDAAVKKLVARSAGSLRSLSVYNLGNAGFSFVCSSGKFLTVLRIPMSEVSDAMVEKYVDSLPALAVLDISYCLNISWRGIDLLGRRCERLVQLRRNMPPPEFDVTLNNVVVGRVDESEATAVASTMPRLEHLELAFGHFDDQGLRAVIRGCQSLRVLDIRGCWNVKLDGDLELLCGSIKSFKDPWEDQYEFPYSPDVDEEEEEEEDDIPQSPPSPAPAPAEDDYSDWDSDDEANGGAIHATPDDQVVMNVCDDDDDSIVEVIQLSDED